MVSTSKRRKIKSADKLQSPPLIKRLFEKIFSPIKKEFSQKWLFYLVSLIAIPSIFLFMKGELMYPDGVGYYLYIQSLFLDRDLLFLNNLESLGILSHDGWFSLNSNNSISNPFAVGTAIVWVPFFFLTHLITLITNLFLVKTGCVLPLNSTSYFYTASASLGSCFYGILALFLSFKVSQRFFSTQNSFLALLAIWLASPFVGNFYWMPTHSHLVDTFGTSLFLLMWTNSKEKDEWLWWFCYGLSFGFTVLVRWQNAILGILLLIPLRRLIIPYLFFFLGSILAFSPQMIAWKIIYGKFFLIPQGEGFMRWSHPEILRFLFSSWHGLYSWTPILILSTIGLFLLYQKDGRIAIGFILVFLIQVYVNACASDWWASISFGARRMTGLTPIFIVGLTGFFSLFSGKKSLFKYLLIGICTFWTWLLVVSMLNSSDYLAGYHSYKELINIQINTFSNLKKLLPAIFSFGPMAILKNYQINKELLFTVKNIYLFFGIFFFFILKIAYEIIMKPYTKIPQA